MITPLATITLLLDAIIHHTVPLLNQANRSRSRSHSTSRKNSKSQYKRTINLTQQPTFNNHHSPPTEPKFKINMYHSNTSSCSQSSDNQANAITPSTWFVNLYIFKPPEDTSLPSKLELLDRGASICVLNTPFSQTVLNVLKQLLKMMNLKHLQPLIKLKSLYYFIQFFCDFYSQNPVKKFQNAQ